MMTDIKASRVYFTLNVDIANTWLVPGITGDIMPAAPAGKIKSCVLPADKSPSLIKDQCSDFHDLFLKIIREMSWIHIFMIEYVVTTLHIHLALDTF